MKVIIVLELELSKPIPELADKAAQRIYVLDGVEDCRVIAQGEKHVDFEQPTANHRLG